jgi:hypothetical protein
LECLKILEMIYQGSGNRFLKTKHSGILDCPPIPLLLVYIYSVYNLCTH